LQSTSIFSPARYALAMVGVVNDSRYAANLFESSCSSWSMLQRSNALAKFRPCPDKVTPPR